MRGWEADSRGLSKSDISRFTEQWNQVRVNEIINDLWVTGTRVQVRFSDGIWSVWRTDTCSTSWLSLFLLKQERKKKRKESQEEFLCLSLRRKQSQWKNQGRKTSLKKRPQTTGEKNVKCKTGNVFERWQNKRLCVTFFGQCGWSHQNTTDTDRLWMRLKTDQSAFFSSRTFTSVKM